MNKPVFRPSFGNRPDRLIGRDEVLNNITDGLRSYPGSSERATLLIGQRGMGKTALLLELSERAQSLGYVAVRSTCGDNMLNTVIELLQHEGSKYIHDTKPPVKGFNAGALGFSFGLTFTEDARRSFGFRVKLEMLCDKLAEAGKGVLLLVDEVDPSIEPMRELAAAYQELAGKETNIAIVMAGLPSSISDILNYKTLTFLNRAERITIDLVPVPEVEMYYQSAFKRASIQAPDDLIKDAAVSTNGFPYLIQLIGFYLSKLTDGTIPVDKPMLEKAKDAASAEMDRKIFQAMLNPLSDFDIAFLKAMAQQPDPVRPSDLEKAMGRSHGTVQTYRKRLLDAGVIIAPCRGRLSFIMPQLADYLRRME